MRTDPLAVARAAAQGFQRLQCEECAQAIRDALVTYGHKGQLIELRAGSGQDYIVCVSYDGGWTSITQNGRHVGVRVGTVVFDNLHPDGIPDADWLADFDAVGGVSVAATTDI